LCGFLVKIFGFGAPEVDFLFGEFVGAAFCYLKFRFQLLNSSVRMFRQFFELTSLAFCMGLT